MKTLKHNRYDGLSSPSRKPAFDGLGSPSYRLTRHILFVALSLFTTCACAEVSDWGTPVDPNGDCRIRTEGEKLTILVPDGVHDLWYGRPDPKHRFSGPRVMQEVEGDFVAQVRVSARWLPYNENTNYGAGLLVWDSETDFIRAERHVFMYKGKPTCFTKPLHFEGNKRVDEPKLADADFFKGSSTWIRVERTGRDITSSISHDGRKWIDTGTRTTKFPGKVKVGVHVFKVSPGMFLAEFDEFSLTKKTGTANRYTSLQKRVVVTDDSASIKSGTNVLGRVSRGTRLTVVQTKGDWYQVRVPGKDQLGWIYAKQVVIVQPSDQPSHRPATTGKEIESWGTPIDPDGDCEIRAGDDKVTITVPGTKHDISMDGKDPATRFNAPRVVKTVAGDFTAVVKVTSDWTLGKALPNGQNAFAAGLLVFDSERQYLRHERILFRHRRLGTINTFVPVIYDRDNARVSRVEVVDPDFFKGRSTWLKLERYGTLFKSSISHDGENWIRTHGVDGAKFPEEVHVGIHAINASASEFEVEFEEFHITQRNRASAKGDPHLAHVGGREIEGWGTVADPGGDCDIRAEDGKVTITVNKGVHDYWYAPIEGGRQYTAPRIMQEINGDFTATVKVTSDWEVTKNYTETNSWVVDAGLIVAAKDQYLRHSRNKMQGRSGQASWVPPIYDRGGTRISEWKAFTDGRPFEGRSSWLRIERSGQTVSTYLSHDGDQWFRTARLETTLPKKAQLGTYAIGVVGSDFVVEFEDFKIERR